MCYGIGVSSDLISTVIDAVLEEVVKWPNRPLDVVCCLLFFGVFRVKIRDDGCVRNKADRIAPGFLPIGGKEILGLLVEQAEDAKF